MQTLADFMPLLLRKKGEKFFIGFRGISIKLKRDVDSWREENNGEKTFGSEELDGRAIMAEVKLKLMKLFYDFIKKRWGQSTSIVSFS